MCLRPCNWLSRKSVRLSPARPTATFSRLRGAAPQSNTPSAGRFGQSTASTASRPRRIAHTLPLPRIYVFFAHPTSIARPIMALCMGSGQRTIRQVSPVDADAPAAPRNTACQSCQRHSTRSGPLAGTDSRPAGWFPAPQTYPCSTKAVSGRNNCPLATAFSWGVCAKAAGAGSPPAPVGVCR